MLTALLKQKPTKEYKAACGCVVRLLPSPPPVTGLSTTTYCKAHQPRELESERDKIQEEARLHFLTGDDDQ